MASSLSLKSPVEPRKSGSPLSTPIPAPAKLNTPRSRAEWKMKIPPSKYCTSTTSFFWGGADIARKTLFFVAWEISRACREDQGIAAGNCLRVQSCRIQTGGWKELKKVRKEKQKKSCTIFHHAPFSIMKSTWYSRHFPLKKYMEKCIAQLKISSDWSLRSSFQSRFNLTLPCVNQATKSAWQRYQWERVTNSCAIHFFVFKMTSCFEFGSLCVCHCFCFLLSVWCCNVLYECFRK